MATFSPRTNDDVPPLVLRDLLLAVRSGDQAATDRLLAPIDGHEVPGGRWGRAWRRWKHRDALNAALRTAAEVGSLAGVERLLPLANPRAGDAEGRTPFYLATLYNHETTAEALLPVSNPHNAGGSGTPPIVMAAKNNMTRLLLPLIMQHRTSPRAARLVQALHAAASRGAHDAVRMLLVETDPSFVDEHGKTALMLAAERGHLQCVDALLQRSDPNAITHRGETALMLAATGGHNDVVERLVPVSNVSMRQDEGKTALHLVAAHALGSSVGALLPLSDPTQPDQDGWTPLMYAAGSSNATSTEVLERLIPVSPIGHVNHDGQTAFDLALAAARQRGGFHPPLWDRVDLLMFHEPSATKRHAALIAGVGKLPRWTVHQEREALTALLTEVLAQEPSVPRRPAGAHRPRL